jgi:hypothetical protein
MTLIRNEDGIVSSGLIYEFSTQSICDRHRLRASSPLENVTYFSDHLIDWQARLARLAVLSPLQLGRVTSLKLKESRGSRAPSRRPLSINHDHRYHGFTASTQCNQLHTLSCSIITRFIDNFDKNDSSRCLSFGLWRRRGRYRGQLL